MVINKNSMGYELNKKKRKKLINLYKQYLEDPEEIYIRNSSEYFVSPATHLFSNTVQGAIIGAIEMFQKKLSKAEAIKVLTDLLKEEKEEEESEGSEEEKDGKKTLLSNYEAAMLDLQDGKVKKDTKKLK